MPRKTNPQQNHKTKKDLELFFSANLAASTLKAQGLDTTRNNEVG